MTQEILHHINPASVGTSLKPDHYRDALSEKKPVDFFEIHAENYMVDEGVHHHYLEKIAERYPLSLHGVGLSLGSADGVDNRHLKRFVDLNTRYKPVMISDHLAWSVDDGIYLNDLLPLPFNQESLDIVAANISKVQDAISRQILVENPSAYLSFTASTMREQDYLIALAEKTGCGILLDANNIVVSGRNMGYDPTDYASDIPGDLVGEIHIAGHLIKNIDGVELRIDDHGSSVSDEVLDLYIKIISRIGPRPTLLEWDSAYPDLDGLIAEATRTQDIAKKFLTVAF